MNYQHDATAYQDERELLGTDPVPARITTTLACDTFQEKCRLRFIHPEPQRLFASRSPHPDRLRN